MKLYIFLMILAMFIIIGLSASDFKNTTGQDSLFQYTIATDISINAVSASMLIPGLLLTPDSRYATDRLDSGETFTKSSVIPFDRWSIRPYNKTLDTLGTVFQYATICTPVLFFFTPKHEWTIIGTMYLESVVLSFSTRDILKNTIRRPRPFVYDAYEKSDYSLIPDSYLDNGDAFLSFPSGHTTMAFNAAAFTTYVFDKYFPYSPWRYVVGASTFTLAGTTATLRILSGNHFASDVLIGAAIGTITGFIVPFLHQNKPIKARKNGTEVSFIQKATGISVSIRW
jgi:undecaprenyl-diphosphatase